MVILIGGASHTGKTLLAKALTEKTGFFTLSLDHLKMGLIRAGITTLTPEDDDALRDYLWPIAAEMVKTAVENRQDLILEGCYIPGNWAAYFNEAYLKEIRAIFLVMTDKYVKNHFGKIQRFANAAEYRKGDFIRREDVLRDNAFFQQEAEKSNSTILLIEDNYEPKKLFQDAISLLKIE